jgi:cofilin
VTVTDDVVSQFNAFKLKKEPYNYRYYVYKISDDGKEIVIDTFGERGASYDEFVSKLPPNSCRYGLFDLDYETQGRPTSKLVFITWAPDTAKVKDKMMYAGSKEAIKSALVGVQVHLQASDQSEVERDHIISVLERV